jgi:hypothetical protein
MKQATFFALCAVALAASDAQASQARYNVEAAELSSRLANWCVWHPGVVGAHDATQMICDLADHGLKAALFEASRGKNGPRRVRVTFSIIRESPTASLVQAHESYVFTNALGAVVEAPIEGRSADKDLRYMLTITGGQYLGE